MTKLLKYAHVERERRFLLRAPPPELDPRRGFERIEDLYLTGTRLRLREVRDPTGAVVDRKLTQKLPDPDGAPARRILTTLYLDAGEYALFAPLPGRRLAKRRHRIASGAHTFAIDVFEGPFEGLVLAELELASEEELAALPVPPFAHCEVTALPLFTGGALAEADPLLVLAEARRLREA